MNLSEITKDIDKLYLLIEKLENIEYPEVSPNFSFILHDVKYKIDSAIQSIKNVVEN